MEKVSKQNKMNALNIIGLVLIVVFLPIIIINMVLVIKSAIRPEQIPMVFSVAPLIVESDSMTIDKKNGTGAFNKNDLIFIKKVDPETLEVGDIITYIMDDGAVVTHRVYAILDEEGNKISKDGELAVETKGDFNSPAIIVIKHSQIVGKYFGRLANIGGIAMFIQTPTGILILLGIPFAIVFIVDLIQRNKNKDNAAQKTAELEAELAKLKAIQAASEKDTSQDEQSN